MITIQISYTTGDNTTVGYGASFDTWYDADMWLAKRAYDLAQVLGAEHTVVAANTRDELVQTINAMGYTVAITSK